MGAETAINAAKQETKYFLVLGAVLVSDFILIVWGFVVYRFLLSVGALLKKKNEKLMLQGEAKKQVFTQSSGHFG